MGVFRGVCGVKERECWIKKVLEAILGLYEKCGIAKIYKLKHRHEENIVVQENVNSQARRLVTVFTGGSGSEK